MTAAAERFAADFQRIRPALPGVYLPWLQEAREEALAEFLDRGFPTTRQEDWKYTSVAPIEKTSFVSVSAGNEVCSDVGCVGTQALPEARLMVFVDGRHAPALSRLGPLPAGVSVAGVAQVLKRDPERLRNALIRPASGYESGFAALNAAFLSDGAYVHLAAGAALEEPLHLLFVTATRGLAVHVRNVVVAEAGSHVRIVEHHVPVDEFPYLTNAATMIRLGRGAAVEHHKLQDESLLAFHIASVRAAVGEAARFASTSFAFGAALSRTGIDVGLDAPDASCTLDGLTVTDGRQHADHHTCIDHLQPHGTSREYYKGVLDGASRAVFNGKVIVHPGAQRTDAQQTNRNLLLSDQAEADSKPQLEIWADDVKCGHGAAAGQIDPDQIFYLRSRGVDAETARAMLVYAFAAEVIERVGVPSLRTRLQRMLRAHLPHGNGVIA